MEGLQYCSKKVFLESLYHALLKRGICMNYEPSVVLAARFFDKEVLDLLTDSGDNCEGCDSEGWTLLHFASRNGWLELVQKLINEGVLDINRKTLEGVTPLQLAAEFEYEDTVNLLIDSGASSENSTVLHSASEYGWLNVVQKLLDRGWDINAKTCRGETPLLVAAEFGNKDVFNLLIDSGASIEGCDDMKWTLLHRASQYGWLDIIQILHERGLDINAQTQTGDTPLHLTCKYEYSEAVEYLLRAGADFNIRDDMGNMPHNYAIEYSCCVETLKLCIEYGAPLTSRDYFKIIEDPLFKGVLQDINLFTKALVNKFNNRDLPTLYKLSISENLPVIGNMKISNDGETAQEIQQYVEQEVQSKGHCNLVKACPIVLRLLSVKAFINYCDIQNKQTTPV